MYVKENTRAKVISDLQNLIVGVILRQNGEFTLDDVIHGANIRLIGTSYYESPELKKHCADTLATVYLFGCIQSTGKDKYVPSQPETTVSMR